MIQGTVIYVTEPHTYSEKFSKQMIVIRTAGNYPDEFQFEFVNDDMAKLMNVNIGDQVAVDYQLRGNRHPKDAPVEEARWYTNLRGTSIQILSRNIHEKLESVEDIIQDDRDLLPF